MLLNTLNAQDSSLQQNHPKQNVNRAWTISSLRAGPPLFCLLSMSGVYTLYTYYMAQHLGGA